MSVCDNCTRLKEQLDNRVKEWFEQLGGCVQQESKPVESERLEGFVMASVRISFSKEVGGWQGMAYYENPNFMKFWDGFNRNPKFRANKKNGQRENLWSVAYFSKQSEEEALNGNYEPSYMRLLTCVGESMTFIISSSGMHLYMAHEPHRYPTVLDGPIHDLIVVMEECAKECGGKATVSVSYPQYFVYEKEEVHSWTVGKDAPFKGKGLFKTNA